MFIRLYLDAQVGGLVQSLIHRGDPLNFNLHPVRENENDPDPYEGEAGAWRLMYNREAQWLDYLGRADSQGFYFGVSHKVKIDTVKEVSPVLYV